MATTTRDDAYATYLTDLAPIKQEANYPPEPDDQDTSMFDDRWKHSTEYKEAEVAAGNPEGGYDKAKPWEVLYPELLREQRKRYRN